MSAKQGSERSYLSQRLEDSDFKKEFDRESLAMNLAGQILLAMEDDGISKADLAAMLGCSRAYVTKMLRGDYNPTIHKISDIAGALGRRVRFQFDALKIEEFRPMVTNVPSVRTPRPRIHWSDDDHSGAETDCRVSEEVAA